MMNSNINLQKALSFPLRWLKHSVHEDVSQILQTKVMRVRAWLSCHTFSSSYSSKASWN